MTLDEVAGAMKAKLTKDEKEMAYVFNQFNLYCDADSVARAQVTVSNKSGELRLCAHHYAVNALFLALDGWEITEDTRDSLTVQTASTVDS